MQMPQDKLGINEKLIAELAIHTQQKNVRYCRQ
jgi:hypothetical protein